MTWPSVAAIQKSGGGRARGRGAEGIQPAPGRVCEPAAAGGRERSQARGLEELLPRRPAVDGIHVAHLLVPRMRRTIWACCWAVSRPACCAAATLAVRAPPVVGTSSAPRSHGVPPRSPRSVRIPGPRLPVDVGGRGERSLDPAAGADRPGRQARRRRERPVRAADAAVDSPGGRARCERRYLQVVVAGEADRRILARRSSRSPSAGRAREPPTASSLMNGVDEERIDADRVSLAAGHRDKLHRRH